MINPPAGLRVPTPIASAILTPSVDSGGARVEAEPLHLDDLPKAMDNMGWKFAAKLMRRWFSIEPAYRMPREIRDGEISKNLYVNYVTLPASQIDTSSIKMQWILGFPSVLPEYEELLQQWNNYKGVNRLIEKLLPNSGWKPGKSVKIEPEIKEAKYFENVSDLNARPFGKYTDTLNDLYGAIFKATFKAVITGKTTYSWLNKKDYFEIDRLGVYIRDTYDFNVDATEENIIGLGIWTKDRMLSKKEMLAYKTYSSREKALRFPGAVPVGNNDFYRWQNVNNKGGDFYVFSDIKWLTPSVDHLELKVVKPYHPSRPVS